MFKKNPVDKQINITDPYHNFPKYIRDMLHNSWAEYFFYNIFSKINEECFSVLFSDKYSRPNTPVNVIVGLLILKEMNQWTDEDLLGAFYFDYRVRYALGITDFEKERLCINTVSNFRCRLYEYAEKYGRDLLGEEVDNLTKELIEVSGMDTSFGRQDSFLISANCKKMGRLELIYTVNLNMVKVLSEEDASLIPESCSHYLDSEDKTAQIYKIKKEEVEEKTKQLLNESFDLYAAVPHSLRETQAFENLARLLEEQTEDSGDGPAPKDSKEISPSSLQNPSEPDATYRKKGTQQSTGYVMNIVEARDEEKKMSMIVHHDLRQNIVSDVELGSNALDSDLKGVETMVSDGAYYSPETARKAEEKDIELSFSALSGRTPPENKMGADQFTVDPETKKINQCPGGYEPFMAEYNEENQQYTARFYKEDCMSCEFADSCIFKEQKGFNVVRFTENKLITDYYRSFMGTERHQKLGDFRAGTEGVPSVLRRSYGIDELPVRGLIRARIWDHCKVMAYNFSSFFRYFKGLGTARTNMLSLLFRYITSNLVKIGTVRTKLCYG